MSKYNHKTVTYKGIKFASIMERDRYIILEALQKAGKITGLVLQVRFEILPRMMKYLEVPTKKGTKLKSYVDETAVHYTCDFAYQYNGKYVIEEVKSEGSKRARDYSLRRKLIKKMIRDHNELFPEEVPLVFNEVGLKKSTDILQIQKY